METTWDGNTLYRMKLPLILKLGHKCEISAVTGGPTLPITNGAEQAKSEPTRERMATSPNGTINNYPNSRTK